ncbi:hypothetical protein NDU88_003022 [Pleurodeles waltl]|uniref:Uncharacterized protein n=1 Tax=Pleurodeles waltl TaxID=8319 RepID=A0AAV7UYT9_PLEWA|nr:hypothetical protein NDU88_003022 [Pleurodeles waltl]
MMNSMPGRRCDQDVRSALCGQGSGRTSTLLQYAMHAERGRLLSVSWPGGDQSPVYSLRLGEFGPKPASSSAARGPQAAATLNGGWGAALRRTRSRSVNAPPGEIGSERAPEYGPPKRRGKSRCSPSGQRRVTAERRRSRPASSGSAQPSGGCRRRPSGTAAPRPRRGQQQRPEQSRRLR